MVKLLAEVGEIIDPKKVAASGSNNIQKRSGTLYVGREFPKNVIAHWYILQEDYDKAIEEEKEAEKLAAQQPK